MLHFSSPYPPKQTLAPAKSVPTLGHQRLHQPVLKSFSLMTSQESMTSPEPLLSIGSVEEPGPVWECSEVGSVLSESLNDLEVIRRNLEMVETVLSGQESLKDDFVFSPIVDGTKRKDGKTEEKSKKDKSKREKPNGKNSYNFFSNLFRLLLPLYY